MTPDRSIPPSRPSFSNEPKIYFDGNTNRLTVTYKEHSYYLLIKMGGKQIEGLDAHPIVVQVANRIVEMLKKKEILENSLVKGQGVKINTRGFEILGTNQAPITHEQSHKTRKDYNEVAEMIRKVIFPPVLPPIKTHEPEIRKPAPLLPQIPKEKGVLPRAAPVVPAAHGAPTAPVARVLSVPQPEEPEPPLPASVQESVSPPLVSPSPEQPQTPFVESSALVPFWGARRTNLKQEVTAFPVARIEAKNLQAQTSQFLAQFRLGGISYPVLRGNFEGKSYIAIPKGLLSLFKWDNGDDQTKLIEQRNNSRSLIKRERQDRDRLNHLLAKFNDQKQRLTAADLQELLKLAYPNDHHLEWMEEEMITRLFQPTFSTSQKALKFFSQESQQVSQQKPNQRRMLIEEIIDGVSPAQKFVAKKLELLSPPVTHSPKKVEEEKPKIAQHSIRSLTEEKPGNKPASRWSLDHLFSQATSFFEGALGELGELGGLGDSIQDNPLFESS